MEVGRISCKSNLQRVRVCRIVRFLFRFKHTLLCCHTGCPDHLRLTPQHHDWDTPCGNVHEETPAEAPVPFDSPVCNETEDQPTTTAWVDANKHHDFLTGIVHTVNQTTIDFHRKKQNTDETLTYGSELVAARMGTDQCALLSSRLSCRTPYSPRSKILDGRTDHASNARARKPLRVDKGEHPNRTHKGKDSLFGLSNKQHQKLP